MVALYQCAMTAPAQHGWSPLIIAMGCTGMSHRAICATSADRTHHAPLSLTWFRLALTEDIGMEKFRGTPGPWEWWTSNSFLRLTGRSIKEVGDRRLQANLERNGWDKHKPEAVTKWEAA